VKGEETIFGFIWHFIRELQKKRQKKLKRLSDLNLDRYLITCKCNFGFLLKNKKSVLFAEMSSLNILSSTNNSKKTNVLKCDHENEKVNNKERQKKEKKGMAKDDGKEKKSSRKKHRKRRIDDKEKKDHAKDKPASNATSSLLDAYSAIGPDKTTGSFIWNAVGKKKDSTFIGPRVSLSGNQSMVLLSDHGKTHFKKTHSLDQSQLRRKSSKSKQLKRTTVKVDKFGEELEETFESLFSDDQLKRMMLRPVYFLI
jgi:hypothetical protein